MMASPSSAPELTFCFYILFVYILNKKAHQRTWMSQ